MLNELDELRIEERHFRPSHWLDRPFWAEFGCTLWISLCTLCSVVVQSLGRSIQAREVDVHFICRNITVWSCLNYLD